MGTASSAKAGAHAHATIAQAILNACFIIASSGSMRIVLHPRVALK
jgi:hypothetical protein